MVGNGDPVNSGDGNGGDVVGGGGNGADFRNNVRLHGSRAWSIKKRLSIVFLKWRI